MITAISCSKVGRKIELLLMKVYPSLPSLSLLLSWNFNIILNFVWTPCSALSVRIPRLLYVLFVNNCFNEKITKTHANSSETPSNSASSILCNYYCTYTTAAFQTRSTCSCSRYQTLRFTQRVRSYYYYFRDCGVSTRELVVLSRIGVLFSPSDNNNYFYAVVVNQMVIIVAFQIYLYILKYLSRMPNLISNETFRNGFRRFTHTDF